MGKSEKGKGKGKDKEECILQRAFLLRRKHLPFAATMLLPLAFSLFNSDPMRWAFYDRQVGYLLMHACIKKLIFRRHAQANFSIPFDP